MEIRTQHTAGISDGMLRGHLQVLAPYLDVLRIARTDTAYRSPESSLALPSDTGMRAHVRTVVDSLCPHVRTVLLVGIGGSDLGTRAIYDGLRGHLAHYATARPAPRLLSFGTIEPHTLALMSATIAEHADPREVVLVVISKSGTTTETIVNANILYNLMVETFGVEAAGRQTILISDPDVAIVAHARRAGIAHLPIPKQVGGRYSVFTPVGLAPLALLGIDIDALCDGARAGARASAPEDGTSSAAVLASCLYEAYLNDLRIHEFFVWHPELETLGKWYRQLLAESIGKERSDHTPVGIMPTVAIGSTDLHSLGQLVFGGPRNRFTTFVAVPSLWDDKEPALSENVFMLDMLHRRSAGEPQRAIYKGVTTTYHEHELPFATIGLNALTERELGACMAVHMASVMCLANLLEVNAFDQPNVEAYKTETRKLLTREDVE